MASNHIRIIAFRLVTRWHPAAVAAYWWISIRFGQAPYPKYLTSSSAGVADLIKIPIPTSPSSGMSKTLTPPSMILNKILIVSSIRRMLLGNNSTIRIIRWVHRVRCSAEMFLYSIYAEDGIICNSLSNMFGNSDNNSLLDRLIIIISNAFWGRLRIWRWWKKTKWWPIPIRIPKQHSSQMRSSSTISWRRRPWT